MYLDRALRRELGKARITFRRVDPDSQEPSSPEALAAAIRAAAERGVAGLIVEPLDRPAVIDALYDALGRGCVVLLLDEPVPALAGKTIPHVEYTGLADAGRQVVADIVNVDGKLKRTGPSRVFVLHHRSDDPYMDRCLASLVEPLRAAGKRPEVVAFERDADRAIAALRKALGADRRIDIVLADDNYGITAAINIRREWAQAIRPEFLIGGYSPYDNRTPEMLRYVRSFADRSVESYAVRTFQAIRSLLDGKPVGDVVGVPVPFHRQTTVLVPTPEKPAGPETKAGKP